MTGFVPWPVKANAIDPPEVTATETEPEPELVAGAEVVPKQVSAKSNDSLIPTVKKAIHPY